MNGVEQKQYRYSLVFILRADESMEIDYEALSSDITGSQPQEDRCKTGKGLFRKIKTGHWNVNMTQKEREHQKKTIAAERAAKESGVRKEQGEGVG